MLLNSPYFLKILLNVRWLNVMLLQDNVPKNDDFIYSDNLFLFW